MHTLQSSSKKAHLHLAREPGWQYAASVIGFLEASVLMMKAGNCTDPDPQSELALVPRYQATRALTEEPTLTPPRGGCGAAPERRADAFRHRDLVKPAFSEPSVMHKSPASKFRSIQELDQLGHEAVMSKLADSTRRAYTPGWRQWSLFMSGTGHPPFLVGESRTEKQSDESWLIRFVVFLHEVMGRTGQGIKQRLSAIRYAHIAPGHPDPLQGRVRLWASLQGLARWENAPVGKVPVTPSMLCWIKRYLAQSTVAECEKAATWTAICTGGSLCLGRQNISLQWTPIRPRVVLSEGATSLSTTKGPSSPLFRQGPSVSSL